MRRSAPTEGLGRPITGRGIAIAIGLYLALNLAWAVISPLIRP